MRLLSADPKSSLHEWNSFRKVRILEIARTTSFPNVILSDTPSPLPDVDTFICYDEHQSVANCSFERNSGFFMWALSRVRFAWLAGGDAFRHLSKCVEVLGFPVEVYGYDMAQRLSELVPLVQVLIVALGTAPDNIRNVASFVKSIQDHPDFLPSLNTVAFVCDEVVESYDTVLLSNSKFRQLKNSEFVTKMVSECCISRPSLQFRWFESQEERPSEDVARSNCFINSISVLLEYRECFLKTNSTGR